MTHVTAQRRSRTGRGRAWPTPGAAGQIPDRIQLSDARLASWRDRAADTKLNDEPAPQRRRDCRRQPYRSGPVSGTADQVRLPGPGSPPSRCPARRAGEPAPASGNIRVGQGVVSCDVSDQVMRKVAAVSAYRSQFPLEPDMFPEFLLQEMFGCEYSWPPLLIGCSAGRDASGGPCLTQR